MEIVVAASKMVTLDGRFCGRTNVCSYSTVVGVTCCGSIPVGGTAVRTSKSVGVYLVEGMRNAAVLIPDASSSDPARRVSE